MTHNRHLMQGWLTIEQDIVTVLQVSLNFVADLEMHVRSIAKHCKVDLSLIMTDDVLSSGPLTRTIFD